MWCKIPRDLQSTEESNMPRVAGQKNCATRGPYQTVHSNCPMESKVEEWSAWKRSYFALKRLASTRLRLLNTSRLATNTSAPGSRMAYVILVDLLVVLMWRSRMMVGVLWQRKRKKLVDFARRRVAPWS